MEIKMNEQLIEEYKLLTGDEQTKKAREMTNYYAQKKECEADTRSYVQVFKDDILFNKTIWLLAIDYVFVYVIRFGNSKRVM